MSVVLGEKVQASGNKSLYLDISYQGKRKKEYLNIVIIKGSTPSIKSENKEKRLIADEIRAKRELEIISQNYEVSDKSKKNIDFNLFFEEYFKNYRNRDYRTINACYKKLKSFLELEKIPQISIKQIDKDFCEKFNKYLQSVLNGDSPYDYFKKFRAILENAVEKEIILKNPAKNVKSIRIEGLKKAILFPEEIQLLANSYCGNEEVKRAFLFCLNSGLRLCDVKLIKWENIADNQLKFIQVKVDSTSSKALNIIDLNQNAINLLGERKNNPDLIFNLPSTTNGCNKVLKNWVKKAGITKKITWHCARHSLAVNLLRSDVGNADIKTVSSILGHSSLKSTEVYTHVVDNLKKTAINSLPNITF